ncbi:MAG: PHP domain-containing protein, partial [Halobacteriaceae archaeon]
IGLAHPFRYDDPESALDVTTKLDAVERYYPYEQPDSAIRNELLETVMKQNNLLPIGGSDAHNDVIGKTGLSKAEYQDFDAALTNSMS